MGNSLDDRPVGSPSTFVPATSPGPRLLRSPAPSNPPGTVAASGLYCAAVLFVRGTPAPSVAAARRSALFLLSSATRFCSSSCRRASRALRSLITSRGVLIAPGVLPTGTGPVVRAPPLDALPPLKSDMDAFSSSSSGVKSLGLRMASSSAYKIAE
jgi:hypothetical protein